MNNYFIKDKYHCNPVRSFDTSSSESYWTKPRLKASEILQYHVYELAHQKFLDFKCNSVLDIGCGPGLKMKKFFGPYASQKDIVLIDQPTTVEIVTKMFPQAVFRPVNLEDGEYTLGRTFDLIVCSDVIEHLADPDALLSIIKKHVNKTGVVVLSTPDRDMRRGIRNYRSPNPDHVREWNFEEFASYIRSHGFSILEHINLPSIKLSPFQMLLHKIFYKRINKAKWYPCQAIVAKLQ